MNVLHKIQTFSSIQKRTLSRYFSNLPKHDIKIVVGGRARSEGKTSESRGFLCNLKMALVPQKSNFPIKVHNSIRTYCGFLLLFSVLFKEFIF